MQKKSVPKARDDTSLPQHHAPVVGFFFVTICVFARGQICAVSVSRSETIVVPFVQRRLRMRSRRHDQVETTAAYNTHDMTKNPYFSYFAHTFYPQRGSDCFTSQFRSIRWTRRAKLCGPGAIRKVGKLDWKKQFPRRLGSSSGGWSQRCKKIWRGFAEKGDCEGGYGCINVADQHAVRAAATLCWRMVGSCLALAAARSTCSRPLLQARPNGSVGC